MGTHIYRVLIPCMLKNPPSFASSIYGLRSTFWSLTFLSWAERNYRGWSRSGVSHQSSVEVFQDTTQGSSPTPPLWTISVVTWVVPSFLESYNWTEATFAYLSVHVSYFIHAQLSFRCKRQRLWNFSRRSCSSFLLSPWTRIYCRSYSSHTGRLKSFS